MFYIHSNGLGSGNSMSRLVQSGMNPQVLRPWWEEDQYGRPTGRNYITVNTGRWVKDQKTGMMFPETQNIITNAPALLRRSDWLKMDDTVQRAAVDQLQFWGDIYGANPYNVPNGMGTIALGDTIQIGGETEAIISMDPIRRSQQNRPVYDQRQMPLPVIHSDGNFTARQIAVTTTAGAPININGIASAGRACAEMAEKLALGTAGVYKFGDGYVYGAKNHPQRMTYTLTRPDAGGYTPNATINEFLAMINMMETNRYNGPYVLYLNNAWNQYLDRDYSTTYQIPTLRQRLRELPKIRKISNLDFMGGTNFQALLIQMTPEVIEGVNGMTMNTVQWEEEGGFQTSFKVLCIYVPRIRTNVAGTKTGIIDAQSA